MRRAPLADDQIFEDGPPRRLMTLIHLSEPLLPNTTARALVVIAVGWLPLAVMVGYQALSGRPEVLASFGGDVGVHSRLLVAAPLLVIAYVISARRLGLVALHFLAGGVLPATEREPFMITLARARGLVRSLWAELVTLALAYGLVLTTFITDPEVLELTSWQVTAVGGRTLSPAGWWHMLVSSPMLLVLILGWFWRVAVWTWFLVKVARLDLQLVAAHPDRSGGLGFLAQSVRAFAVVGMGMGALAAGRFANVHLSGAAGPLTNPFLFSGTAALVLLLGVGPLLAFCPRLMSTWRSGSMAYGALAMRLGRQFEHEWLTPQAERPMLDRPDFSATTDLYQVVGNVFAMRFVPVDLRSVAILLAASLAPFVPAMFLSMPTSEVIAEIKGLLF